MGRTQSCGSLFNLVLNPPTNDNATDALIGTISSISLGILGLRKGQEPLSYNIYCFYHYHATLQILSGIILL